MARKRKALPYVVFISVIAVLVVSISILSTLNVGENKPVSVDPTSSNVSTVSSEEPEKVKEPSYVKMIGVGDNLIHSGIYSQAKVRAGGVGYDFTYAYENIAKYIEEADIASINQETMLASIYEPSSYPMFNSPTQLGDHMVNIGFDVFNQANNHCIDKGEKGIISTLDFWRTKPNTLVTGVYKNQEDYNRIRTLEINGIVFSFIGMTELTNGLNLPKNSEVVLMRTADEEKIKERIEKAKEISDVVVVNVHWGVEYTHTPNQTQYYLAKKMIEWGADIIFGHHPHVIQPIEYIERADGTKGIVCYSLGNFISAQDKAARMLGGMLQITLKKEFENNTVSIDSVSYEPVVTHYDSNFSNIRNYLLKDYTKDLANKHGVKANSPNFSLDYLNQTVSEVIDEQFLKSN